MNSEITEGIKFQISRMIKDMNFVGTFTIIYGAFTCLSIIGAAIGIPLIFAGIRLREAADSFNLFENSSDRTALYRGFEKQGRFFYIQKIIIIITLVILAIYILFLLLGLGFLIITSSDQFIG